MTVDDVLIMCCNLCCPGLETAKNAVLVGPWSFAVVGMVSNTLPRELNNGMIIIGYPVSHTV